MNDLSVVRCHRTHLIQRCRERGVTLRQAAPCVVSQDGEFLMVDVEHPAYPSRRRAKQQPKQPIGRGPGTEMKKLLKKFGIMASPNCSCNARANMMDEWGPDVCETKMDLIVGWLREEASKRKLPFVDMAGRMLIKRAIRNYRKIQLDNK